VHVTKIERAAPPMFGTRSLCRRRTVTYSPSAAAHHHTQPPTPRERRAIACSHTVRRHFSHAPRLTRSFSPRGLLRTQPSAKPRTSCAALSPPPASRPPPTAPDPALPCAHSTAARCALHVGSRRKTPTLGQLWTILAGLSAL
jgi:hypothetical protein